MTKKVIIFNQPNGDISLVVPTTDCLQQYTIEEIAVKDVPAGRPFKIVNVSDLPSDFTFIGAWSIDNKDLTDGHGSVSNEFPVKKGIPNGN